jgi:hypothetical protein
MLYSRIVAMVEAGLSNSVDRARPHNAAPKPRRARGDEVRLPGTAGYHV